MFDKDLGCHSCGATFEGDEVHCHSCGSCLLDRAKEPGPFFDHRGRAFLPCWLLDADRALLCEVLEDRSNHDEFISCLVRAKLSCTVGVISGGRDLGLVTTNSRVAFRFEGGATQFRTLVHRDHDIMAGKQISVMTPLGLALLGMREGYCAPVLRRIGTVQMVILERVKAAVPTRLRETKIIDGKAGIPDMPAHFHH